MNRLFALLVVVAPLVAGCAAAPSESTAESSDLALTQQDAATQMTAIVKTAKASAADLAPGGRCYAAVAKYIDTNGYGKMSAQHGSAIGSLPAIPNDYGAYAHQFADYANQPGHAAALGLQRLALDNPYSAPAGAIVVVRAGTPGTSNPTAGDISIAAGEGVFYNDGAMSYHGSASFPSGNDFVLGIYVPQGANVPGAAPTCSDDSDCNHGAAHTGKICSNNAICSAGCHDDDDCPTSQSCSHAATHWTCR